MITHVLLDLDGVVRLYDNSKLFSLEKEYGVPKGSTFSVVFEQSLLYKAITGLITDAVWKETSRLVFEQQFPTQTASLFIEELWNSPYSINTELCTIIKDRFPQAMLVLVTNATTRLHDDLIHANITNVFEKVYNSSEIGYAKPDRLFYTTVLEDLDITTDACIYIDDSSQLINAAKELKIKSYLYTGDNDRVSHWINNI